LTPAPSGSPEDGALLAIGEILGAHGVTGAVRLRSFAEMPAKIAEYCPLVTENGERSFAIASLRPGGSPEIFVAQFVGIASRNAAEALAGTRLHVPRERVAARLKETEFLHADLIGCDVERGGERIGKVVAVQNFGAGDLLEVALMGHSRTEFLPFAEAFVPVIDLAQRKILIADGVLPSPE